MPNFSTQFDPQLAIHYKNLFELEDCTLSFPQYTFFQAKSADWQATFYKSGKVLVQGKNIEYITKKFFNAESVSSNIQIPYPHIGCDESGKGDFFGPLVASGCLLNEKNAKILKEMGAQDSKKMNDKKILALEPQIKKLSVYDVVVISNKKYNELYSKFNNLNKLLAWAHVTVIENILNKIDCDYCVLDKFADESVVLSALKEKGKKINLTQMPKAESDIAVACASILARAEFVKRMDKMSNTYKTTFPKGASNDVINCGREFVKKYGFEELVNVSKKHFKTYDALIAGGTSLFDL